MNLRIVTFLAEDSEAEVKELVADFCEALIARGYSNDVEDTSSSLKSIVVVKDNSEIYDSSPEEFFREQLSNPLLTVIPTDTQPENPEEE